MRFACQSCNTRYTLSDEKVKGRELKIRCKKCSEVMVVRDPALEADQATRTVPVEEALRLARETAPAGRSPWEAETRTLAAEESRRLAAETAPTEEWFAMRNGEQLGPLSREALGERIAGGELGPRNYVWREGMDDWQRIQTVPELASWLPAPAPAEPPPAPEPEPTAVAAVAPDEPTTRVVAAEPTPVADGWSVEERSAVPAAPLPVAAPKPRNFAMLRLMGAGLVLAGLVAAGAYFFLPTGPAAAPLAEATPPIGAGRPVRLADFVVPKGIDKAALREALSTRLPGYERCVADHAGAGARKAHIVVRAVIAPSGAVTAATVAGGGGGELGICLADRTRDIRFPPFEGAPIEIELPFEIAVD